MATSVTLSVFQYLIGLWLTPFLLNSKCFIQVLV
jgi:hypothetical protein